MLEQAGLLLAAPGDLHGGADQQVVAVTDEVVL